MSPFAEALARGTFLRPTRKDLNGVLALAIPVVLVQVGLMAMGVVDTIMVGRVSPEDLAAVALGNLYFFTVGVFGMGVLMALDPLVSQALGAQDPEGAARAFQRGIVLAGLIGLLTSILLLPAEPIFSLLRQPEDVIPMARGYAWWTIPGALPFYGFIVLRQTLQGMARVTPILWTTLIANLLNVFLNWVLIWGNLGAPRLGAVGSAMASSASRWFMMLFLLAVAWPLLRGLLAPIRSGILSLAPLSRMLRLGTPIGVQFQFEFGAFALIGVFTGWIGVEAMAGHQIALNLASLTFMVPVGIASAGAVRVGRAVGAGDPAEARRAAGAALLLGFGFMLTMALSFLGFPGLFGRLYTDDPGVLDVVLLLLPIAGVFQVFDGLQAVSSGILRGIGDTRAPMWINLFGFWAVGIPLSLWFGFSLGGGVGGLWWGLAVGLLIVAIFLVRRVHVRMGRDLERVRIDER
jgi:multidrug resistance protein, MATE family